MGVQIKLNNPNHSFFAGQAVDGQVVVSNTKLNKVKGVVISLTGQGLVQWNSRRTSLLYKSKEIYVSFKASLLGLGENGIFPPEGTITYPFHFNLPTNIPSTFSSQSGQVSYDLQVEITRSTPNLNYRAHLPFTVKGIFDLSLQAGASLPQELKMTDRFILSRKKLNVILKIPRTGFVPGEVVELTAEIENKTNKKVKSMKASLKQVTKYWSEGEHITVTEIISQLDGPDITEKKCGEWTGHLRVPSVPPTGLGGKGRIIDVQYCLNFEITTSGFVHCLSGDLPIIIGTVPLRSTLGSFCQASSVLSSTSEQDGSGSVDGATCASLCPDYSDLPPPSYLEALAAAGIEYTLHSEKHINSRQNESGHEHYNGDNLAVNRRRHENEIPNSNLS